ncbi:MAG: HAMP domain-containing protein [Candidatus Eremiobacteraeota bacterium]|nr:HAMP domain-containing protein [Candidatus Eremiobacteraeota bacterium]MCW5867946.1 HAMP domain-containing protein [Candidatus Eremiobacteraeota bacterium]
MVRANFIQRLPIRWVILGATLATLIVSMLVWTLGAFWLGQTFLWYSQVYRMVAQVRIVWTGQEPEWGSRNGLPVSDSYPEDAPARVAALDSRGTSARIFDTNGRLLAQSANAPEVPEADLDHLHQALSLPEDTRNRNIAYTWRNKRFEYMVLLLPIRQNHHDVGVLQFTSVRFQPRDLSLRMLGYLGVAAGVALLVSGMGALWVAHWLAVPIERLQQATLKLQKGDFKARTGLSGVNSRNEVFQLSAAFDEMADSVEYSLETQRRFVADASHELKTPLTAIGGMADMLKLGQDPEKQRKAVDIIARETDRMSKLVADLLTLSKAGQKPAEQTIEHLSLTQTLEETVDVLCTLHPQRKIEVDAEKDIYLMGNRDELTRLMRNLLDNAVAYTPASARIRASLRLAEEGVVLEVADEGPGIEARDLPFLFERFYRPDSSRARKTGGSGLGLAIVQSIAARHNGRVSVTSEVGKGSCFRVVFGGRK